MIESDSSFKFNLMNKNINIMMINKKRMVGLTALVLSAVLMQVGSVWLFATGFLVSIAGPAAIFAWPVGAIIMSFIAMTIAEVAPCFSTMGGIGRYMQYSHGNLAAFIADWAGFLGLSLAIIAETIAVTQYASSWPFFWSKGLYDIGLNKLSMEGLLFTTLLVIILFLINIFSVKFLMNSIKWLGLFKCIVIVSAIFIPLICLFPNIKFGNFTAFHGTVAPYGWSSVWTAIAIGGVIPAFIGFQAPVTFAGETKRPGRNIPLAIILSIVISMLVFTSLQFTFIICYPLEKIGGSWANISLQSPYVTLTIMLGIHFLTLLLYTDAAVAPTATGIILMGVAPRTLYGLHSTNHLPGFIGKLTKNSLIPLNALVMVLILAIGFLWFVPSWQSAVSLLTLCFMVNFLGGPAAAMGLRRNAQGLRRRIRIPFISVFSFLAFIFISFLLLDSGFKRTSYMTIALTVGFLIYIHYEYKINKFKGFKEELKSALWIVLYMPFITFMDFLGSSDFDGIGIFQKHSIMHLCIFTVGIILFFIVMVKTSRRTKILSDFIDARGEGEII